jgi:glycine/D-amino acid oxidase-like deaminating enzyme
MILILHPDNTVQVKGGVTVNSTHSHKAGNAFVKVIADALPYKGAQLTTEQAQERSEQWKANTPHFITDDPRPRMVYDTASAVITVGDRTFTPDTDLTGEDADLQTFCNTVWDNGGRTLYEARQAEKQAQENLQNG